MIDELKSENIKFNEISEKEALNYLKQNNNYYNICLYKNSFEKYYINGKYYRFRFCLLERFSNY